MTRQLRGARVPGYGSPSTTRADRLATHRGRGRIARDVLPALPLSRSWYTDSDPAQASEFDGSATAAWSATPGTCPVDGRDAGGMVPACRSGIDSIGPRAVVLLYPWLTTVRGPSCGWRHYFRNLPKASAGGVTYFQ